MITTQEIIKTIILGFAIVYSYRMLKKPRRWNEIERVVKVKL